MRALQTLFPNKITEPFLGTESVLSKPDLRKGPCGDYFKPHNSLGFSTQPSQDSKPPNFLKVTDSSLALCGLKGWELGHMVPAPGSPLPSSPHVPITKQAGS